ncbi:hypothetical protein RR42_s3005 [Cupriavidus basilensis]|uniref:Uncharacterized protein n=1 Tax=Cupriavidus basilensis TaxID=68895 RepID=A0A0C4YVL5_9BURK|nr:hypothetical protein RR42_s3005 [Cupriavidus basilensis]
MAEAPCLRLASPVHPATGFAMMPLPPFDLLQTRRQLSR